MGRRSALVVAVECFDLGVERGGDDLGRFGVEIAGQRAPAGDDGQRDAVLGVFGVVGGGAAVAVERVGHPPDRAAQLATESRSGRSRPAPARCPASSRLVRACRRRRSPRRAPATRPRPRTRRPAPATASSLRASSTARRACPALMRHVERNAAAAVRKSLRCQSPDRAYSPIARNRRNSTRSASRHIRSTSNTDSSAASLSIACSKSVSASNTRRP